MYPRPPWVPWGMQAWSRPPAPGLEFRVLYMQAGPPLVPLPSSGCQQPFPPPSPAVRALAAGGSRRRRPSSAHPAAVAATPSSAAPQRCSSRSKRQPCALDRAIRRMHGHARPGAGWWPSPLPANTVPASAASDALSCAMHAARHYTPLPRTGRPSCSAGACSCSAPGPATSALPALGLAPPTRAVPAGAGFQNSGSLKQKYANSVNAFPGQCTVLARCFWRWAW